MSILQKLTEGVQSRDMRAEGTALLNKWEATGLLEGLGNETQKQGMAVLLENQAKELLREASSMAAGDVEGFAAVAFPIVRRVFGGLIANDLISVQPMSLPSGLIFFMDFTHNSARFGREAGESVYGGGVVGKNIIDGVSDRGILEEGFYGLGHAYAAATGSATMTTPAAAAIFSSAVANNSNLDYDPDLSTNAVVVVSPVADDFAAADIGRLDPGAARAARLADSGHTGVVAGGDGIQIFQDASNGDVLICALDNNGDPFGNGATGNDDLAIARLRPVRRLTDAASSNGANGLKTVTHLSKLVFELISITDCGPVAFGTAAEAVTRDAAGTPVTLTDAMATATAVAVAASTFVLQIPIRDTLQGSAGNSLGAIIGASPWGLEEPTPAGGSDGADKASGGGSTQAIPEIDIKVDSVAVTAQTKKLKAKWTPELGQDLNAYHNLDAEVELTGILSEQIALEIDRELLGELVDGAKAGTRYWSRAPGLFVNSSGTEIGASSAAPDFTGTVSEWYETLIETINDVSAQIHRKTLRGGANFVVCSPEVANILEFTSGFRASVTADQDRGTIGAVKSGSLSKKFDVYVDPYFLRNVLLVGRKGSSFLESGYVYAPYVPLQVTPTIFGTEDFVPRKGVMTRYAKKMVRPDMYGLVIVRGLLGEAGATA